LGNLEYLTADLESPIADYHFDLHEIPFDAGQFDTVLCNHVMEHVRDDKKVLSEILRILKPDGFAILQVPLDPNLEKTYEDSSITDPRAREKHFGQKDHVRLYGRDYPEILRKCGFNVIEWVPGEHLSEEEVEKFRLAKTEILYIAKKP
jgi:SAM-dependent methyltransferase